MTIEERRKDAVESILTNRRGLEQAVTAALDAYDKDMAAYGLPIRNDTRAVWLVGELVEEGWLQ